MAVEQSSHRFQLGAWVVTTTLGWTVGLALGSATSYTVTDDPAFQTYQAEVEAAWQMITASFVFVTYP